MSPQSQHVRTRSHRRTKGGAAVCGALLVVLAARGAAQPAGPAADVRFTVTEAATSSQVITVPLSQSVLVDFSVPVREVHVVDAAVADVAPMTPRQILVTGKNFGTTQLIVVVDGDQQRTITVAVDIDLARLQASIDQAVPRARVKASGILGNVVLGGTVPDAESAERITQIARLFSKDVLNQMRVAGVQQVLLRCTVAEVNRTATRQLGFNGWLAGDNLHDIFLVNQLNGINPANIGAAGSIGPIGGPNAGRIPFVTDQNGLPLQSTTTLSLGFPRVQMQLFIQALRENGLLQVLAEPNLVTLSGQAASFLAGGEFPIPVPQGSASNAITIEFRQFGVLLNFTPTVLGSDLVRLKVAPEISEPDFSTAVTISGFVVPGLTQRRVETTVELAPGQTFAIGGLLSERTRGTSSKVPALGDIPVLGALFSSVEYQSSETELVVLVTPELVAPLNPDQVAYVPGADMVPPNDWELFGLGKLEGAQPAPDPAGPDQSPPPAATLRLRGPIGPAGANEGT